MHPLDFRKPYELIVQATLEDIDTLGHVNNTVYLRWVQEVAIAHWRTIATPEQQAEMVWMVLRHEIDYQAAARVHDQILLKTWIGTAAGLRFHRHTEILNIERQLLATAKTIWCPVDPITQRPKKISREVRKMFSAEE
ncbi:MAG TPA: thioesterase family protein [Gemmatales bacterium]|nr:thioesterase family protein [Gemmatales bacterium]HMP18702.1 thioesterase family protein [Gemmatales bacterium]